ncbi:MAG: M23 family metallopeptidase [Candidatus Riflebacteria bacterium]|nr:M23 family metallopeptidase [Candidatus Riflebacteria bacterium]
MNSSVLKLLGIFLLSGGIAFAQAADVDRAILHYDFNQPLTEIDLPDNGEVAQSVGVATDSPAMELQTFLVESLLDKMGKKEQKIVRQVLQTGIDRKIINIKRIEKRLGQINLPAIMGLYSDLRALKITKASLKNVENIQKTLTSIDAALKKADLRSSESGKLSFFAGLARDRLANVAASPAEKEKLRAAAIENYNETVEKLAEDTTYSSKEKVSDSLERLETLRNPFGNLIPVGPVKGSAEVVITSDYGSRIHPVKKTRRFHSGIDLAGWKCNGWKVLAIGSGRVIKSGWESGYGYSVVVAHEVDGQQLFTRYAHLMKKNRLPTGMLVKTGDQVGICNNSGISTGAHLHFEVREDSASGVTRDPKDFLPPLGKL